MTYGSSEGFSHTERAGRRIRRSDHHRKSVSQGSVFDRAGRGRGSRQKTIEARRQREFLREIALKVQIARSRRNRHIFDLVHVFGGGEKAREDDFVGQTRPDPPTRGGLGISVGESESVVLGTNGKRAIWGGRICPEIDRVILRVNGVVRSEETGIDCNFNHPCSTTVQRQLNYYYLIIIN